MTIESKLAECAFIKWQGDLYKLISFFPANEEEPLMAEVIMLGGDHKTYFSTEDFEVPKTEFYTLKKL